MVYFIVTGTGFVLLKHQFQCVWAMLIGHHCSGIPFIALMSQPICICQSEVRSSVRKWNVCHMYFIWLLWLPANSPVLTDLLINLSLSPPLAHFHSLLSSTRNACGSTRMRRSGLQSSGSCVHLIRAWKTCSTMGFSSQLAMGGTASSWMKSASFESTPSQSARASRLWR